MMKDTKPLVQEVQLSPSRINTQITYKHIIIKLLKTKDKKQTLKQVQKKMTYYLQRRNNKTDC